MSIAELFIKRPVMTTLVMLGILLFGVMGYRALAVSDLPNVDFPTIQVQAQLPGANPDTMASSVATPLERQFSTIAGLDNMTSTSALGITNITVQFSLDRSLDAAAQDIQAAITAASKQLPPNLPIPPSYQKVNPADQPILYISLNSPTLPLSTVDEYGETLLAERISTVNGVAQVQVFGSQKYAVHVQLDPRELATRGIGIDEVQQAVENANVNIPMGTLYGPHQAFTVQATGQLQEAKAYRPIIVAYRKGNPVRLEELGRVIDSVQNDKVASWYASREGDGPMNIRRAVMLAIQKQPGTNTVEVVDGIKKIIPSFREQIPASVHLDFLYDRSQSIRDSVNDVKFTLLLTIFLVVLVIFLFLRNVSATAIPSLALPMSIVGTFAVMYLLNYSLDNLSLMALTLSVGFVVDDAIVMLENIVRHTEMGEPPMQAALSGAKEIGFTIISMTISLAAVFIPVLFMGGILGRLFHEFAVTIGASILVSGLVSLSLTPMLCSRFLRPHAEQHHGRFYNASERVFDGMLSAYDWTLRRSLTHRPVVVVVSVALLVATLYLFTVVPKGFIPNQDTGQLFGFTEAAQDISFDGMARNQQMLARIVGQDRDIMAFSSSIGAGGPNALSNTGRVFMLLRQRSARIIPDSVWQWLRPRLAWFPSLEARIPPRDTDRKRTPEEIIEDTRRRLGGLPGIRAFFQNPPLIRIGGSLTKSLYQYTLQGADTAELYKYAPLMESKMRQLPGLQDVNTDLLITSPQVIVDIDREKASALGVTAGQIENALYDAYGQRQISTIYTPSNEYWVIMELLPQYQRDPQALSMLYIRSSAGQLVPLNAVARLAPSVGPLAVNHTGQLPSVTISFNLRPGVALGDAVNDIEKIGRTDLPPTIATSFQGVAQAFQSSLSGMGILLVMAILVIYLVLGILYESFIHPITILSGLPSAGFGALVTLLIFHSELNIYSFVGIIMLVGIVKKNAIMMIDFALEAQRNEGLKPEEAIYQACLVRFRPIMMTSMAALMGTLPIAVGFGAGGDARRPLGLSVVGGLVVSQLLTLYITPVIYIYLESARNLFRRRRRLAPVQEVPVAGHAAGD